MKSLLPILCIAWSLSVHAEEIRSVAAARATPPEVAASGLPVDFEAQVIRAHPRQSNFFVTDQGKGIYIFREGFYTEMSVPKPGDWVRVRGVTQEGNFATSILATDVEILENRPLPAPRPFRLDELYSAGSDCDYVEVEGRLIDMLVENREGYDQIVLSVELSESIPIGITVPYEPADVDRFKELMYHTVRFTGVAGTVFNGQRQLTGRTFIAQSANDFERVDENLGEPPLLPMGALMSVGMDYRMPVRTRGVVTYASADEIHVGGRGSSLLVAVLDGSDIRVGQTVELEGQVWPHSISPAFRAWKVTVIEEFGPIPEPIDINLGVLLGTGESDEVVDSEVNNALVRIQAELVDTGKSFGMVPRGARAVERQSLLCRSEGNLFEARLPEGLGIDDDWRPGATLELTGICNLIEGEHLYARVYFNGLWLQLRDTHDVVILRPASWWTPRRLVWGLAVALGTMALFLIWIAALRKTVSSQTSMIGQQIRRESVLNERQRVARELHDTLEQGLTALSIQLRNLYRSITTNPDGAHASIETAEYMLGVCREEARASVQDLRGGILEKMDLQAAIRQKLAERLKQTDIAARVEVEGAARRLTLFAEQQILRVVLEAARNAKRHGDPSEIEIRLVYASDTLSVIVKDNGKGFDTGVLRDTDRFGVIGMQERAGRLNGTLSMESEPGRGTRVEMVVPMEELVEEGRL